MNILILLLSTMVLNQSVSCYRVGTIPAPMAMATGAIAILAIIYVFVDAIKSKDK